MKKLIVFVAVILLLPAIAMAQKKEKPAPKVYDLIVGAYTSPDGNKGITVYRFYAETGKLSYLSEIDGVDNPSYLCVSPDRKFVYSVNETAAGEVSAFQFDHNSGSLKLINKQHSMGASPAHISIDKEAKNVIVSNYNGGSVSVLPINQTGGLLPAVQTVNDEGGSVNKERQAGPHAHSAIFTPDGKFVIHADLGTDKLYISKYKAGKNPPLTPVDEPFLQVKPGNGPRHMEFAPNRKFLYLVQEMSAVINVYAYNKGKLTFVDSAAMSPPWFTGRNGAADIHVSPDGRFLYATNRGTANELLVYAIDELSGKLQYVTRYPTGDTPRNFVIEPGGRFLLVANQKSNNIKIYQIDKKTGILAPLNISIPIQAPACLKLVSAE